MNRFILFSIILISFSLSSCRLSKGYQALEVYNYFEAKNKLEKSLKKDESPAAYGLSLIYFRNDNPFHDIDSAYHYSLLSVESFNDKKPKRQEKWLKKVDYTLEKSKEHREMISDLAFKEVLKENSVEGFRQFITKYPWSKKIDKAEAYRDSLAFLKAKEHGTSEELEKFMLVYGKNKWYEEATSLLEEAQYKETVQPDDVESYLRFIEKYPSNSHINEAHKQVYLIETKDNKTSSYEEFINKYPENIFLEDAWEKLYRLSIANYNKKSIEQFAAKYPEFPYPEWISRDLGLVGKSLYLYAENGKFGFIDDAGTVKIPAKFEYAEPFKNGLALVLKDDLYGYINKEGQLMINYHFEEAYDFDQGRAVVMKDEYYGLIDVSGNFILPPQYDDIGPFSDGLCYVETENGYQYYNLDGKLAFPFMFEEAFTFSNGIAQVSRSRKHGFIGKDGHFLIAVSDGRLRHFTDSLFIHEMRGGVNFLNTKGEYLYDNNFDRIGVLENNMAIVEKEGKYGYVDANADVKIPLKYIPYSNYMQFSQFYKDHVVYKQGNNYAMADKTGKRIIPALFTGMGKYGELIPVTKGRGWGYVNASSQLKIDYKYDYAHEFINGVAVVELDDLSGVIDVNSKEVLPIEYESIKQIYNDELLLVKQNGLFGLIRINGNSVAEIEFNKITELGDGLIQLVKDQEISYFDVMNNRFITLRK